MDGLCSLEIDAMLCGTVEGDNEHFVALLWRCRRRLRHGSAHTVVGGLWRYLR
jgi:hypothetical protein